MGHRQMTDAYVAALARHHGGKLASILAHHPNIVQVFDKGRDGGLAYIVMELVQGDDLDKSLVPGQGLPIARALATIDELLQALGHAHAKGIIHRDIKPANLMIDPQGHVKLTDFGIARITESDDVTRFRGVAVGTTSYRSPEQTRCDPLDQPAGPGDQGPAGARGGAGRAGPHPAH